MPALETGENCLLRALSNSRGLSGIALDWLVVIGLLLISEASNSRVLYGFAAALIAGRIAGFSLKWTHEAAHRTLFRSRSWNDRLQFLFALPVFSSVPTYRDWHLQHHDAQLNKARSACKPIEHSGMKALTLQQWLLRPLTGIHNAKLILLIARTCYRDAQYRRSILTFWSIILSLFYCFACLKLLFYYWLIPFFVIFPVLLFWITAAQHHNTVSELGTRHLSGWFNSIFFAESRNYHAAHDLDPEIPWFNLKQASRLMLKAGLVDEAHGFIELTRQITKLRGQRTV